LNTMNAKVPPETEGGNPASGGSWISWVGWGIALACVAGALYLAWQKGVIPRIAPQNEAQSVAQIAPISAPVSTSEAGTADLPAFQQAIKVDAVYREGNLETIIPNRPRQEIEVYTVEKGDSVFGIAGFYNIEPETVLWSNYDTLKDNPHAITEGMALNIPPVNGVYYQWQEGDTFESVAAEFEIDPADILGWGGNKFDLTNPGVEPDSWVMLPGGQREFQQWIVPIIPRGAAGVSTGMYGAGACPGGYEGGAYGTGSFIWPSINHTISGNDYWSGHLAIDIGAAMGEPISASDSGVIVFAGWATGGYGNAVAIDHGNGYQTLYAHLSQVNVRCGQSVSQGQNIGLGGSTGNSTGAHLHFEIRYQGGFVNPWYVLPAP
jgi:murein DD-endopeptidase MepM/ murein hydrolase activator NlpD